MLITKNIIKDSFFFIMHEKRKRLNVRIKERIAMTAIIIYKGSVFDVEEVLFIKV